MNTSLVSPEQLKKQILFSRLVALFLLILGLLSILTAIEKNQYLILLFNLPFLIVLPIVIINGLRNIHSMTYDEKAVYMGKSADRIKNIPFDNIRSISIGKFDFSFRINLYHPVDGEKYLQFKSPVLWFPFAPRLKKERIYDFRDRVDQYKKSMDADYEDETPIIIKTTLG